MHKCGACGKQWTCPDLHATIEVGPLIEVEGFEFPKCFFCWENGENVLMYNCPVEWKVKNSSYFKGYRKHYTEVRMRLLTQFLRERGLPLPDGRRICGCNQCEGV